MYIETQHIFIKFQIAKAPGWINLSDANMSVKFLIDINTTNFAMCYVAELHFGEIVTSAIHDFPLPSDAYWSRPCGFQ